MVGRTGCCQVPIVMDCFLELEVVRDPERQDSMAEWIALIDDLLERHPVFVEKVRGPH